MKKILVLLLLLFFLPISYSVSPIISCKIYNFSYDLAKYSNGCFLLIYNTENTHVALCNKSFYLTNPKYVVRCYILANDTERTLIPIEFTENCSNPLIYVYQVENSHIDPISSPSVDIVPRANIKICLKSPFRSIISYCFCGIPPIECLTSSSCPPAASPYALYKFDKNQHLALASPPIVCKYLEGKGYYYSVYGHDTYSFLLLQISNFGNPKTSISPSNNSVWTFLKVSFKDSDTIPFYKCFYRYGSKSEIDSKPWIERPCGSFSTEIYTNLPEIYVESKVINLAGNALIKRYRYLLIGKHLDLRVGLQNERVMGIGEGYLDIPIEIKNIGRFDLKNITFKFSSSGNYTHSTNCTDIQVLHPGETYHCNVKYFPYKIGRYKLVFEAQGYIDASKYGKTVPDKDTEVRYLNVRSTSGFTISAEPSFVLPILLLIFAAILVIR